MQEDSMAVTLYHSRHLHHLGRIDARTATQQSPFCGDVSRINKHNLLRFARKTRQIADASLPITAVSDSTPGIQCCT